MVQFKHYASDNIGKFDVNVIPTSFIFEYGYFIIDGIKYKHDSEAFRIAFGKERMWNNLQK